MKFKKVLPTLVGVSRWLPKRHPLKAKAEKLSCKPFFVISSGRSGTTLLAALLDQHSKILVPPEQFALANAIIKYRMYNYIEWLDMVSIIAGEFARSKASMNWNLQTGELIQLLSSLPKNERSLRKILDEIYVAYGYQHNNSFAIWGDKSPMNTDYFNYILPVFPDAKYIALIRDGRDVAASIAVKNATADVAFAAHKWNHSIRVMEKVKKAVAADHFLLVRYEDLVQKPKEIVDQVLQFLNIESEDLVGKQLDYTKKMGAAGQLKAFENIARPISDRSIGKWQSNLPEDWQDPLMKKIGPNMRKYGYL